MFKTLKYACYKGFFCCSGDAKYKPYVTARPDIALVELDGDEDFVVVACDGLWDFVSEDEVALSIYAQLAADPGQFNVDRQIFEVVFVSFFSAVY